MSDPVDVDSSSDLDDPVQPLLTRDAPPVHYAPEITRLIRAGILDNELEVCRGWVESGRGSARRFVAAPTVEEMTIVYNRDQGRRVHTVKLSKETVLDFPKMCELERVLSTDEFRELSQEWELMVVWLFRANFGDP